MVFLYHIDLINHIESPLIRILHRDYFQEGQVGVSFFFILSGFILSTVYSEKLLQNKIDKSFFLVSRLARIYPLHLFTLILFAAISVKSLIAYPVQSMLYFVYNVLLIKSFFPAIEIYYSYNGPSWSISDELFFYVCFPFIITYIERISLERQITFIMFLVVILITGMMFFPSEYDVAAIFKISPFVRIIDFYIGIVCYKLSIKIPDLKVATATFLELLSILLFVLAFFFHYYIPEVYRFSIYYWLPMAVIIIIFSKQKGFFSAILSNNILILLGEISFSFYLLQLVIFRYIDSLYKYNILRIENDYLSILFHFTTVLVASFFVYKLVEKPLTLWIKNKFLSLRSGIINTANS